jgi:hypothetical protein
MVKQKNRCYHRRNADARKIFPLPGVPNTLTPVANHLLYEISDGKQDINFVPYTKE